MSATPVLISSPFLGPAVWEPVGQELREVHGVPATTIAAPDLRSADPKQILAALRAQLPEGDDLLLVPHSNAGLYVPLLVDAATAAGAVFVDAILPPSTGSVAVAPPSLREALGANGDDTGLLPAWTEWWPESAVGELFPDPEVRRRVESEQRRLPADYLAAEVRMPSGWDQVPGAYLAFGDTYAEAVQVARGRGWPVSTMPGNHLHMVWEPEGVAAEIVRLAGLIGNSA